MISNKGLLPIRKGRDFMSRIGVLGMNNKSLLHKAIAAAKSKHTAAATYQQISIGSKVNLLSEPRQTLVILRTWYYFRLGNRCLNSVGPACYPR